jgi:phosphatidylethanolamine N-methyltransferase
MVRDSLYGIPILSARSPFQQLLARFHKAIAEQPHAQILAEPLNVVVPAVLVGLGQLFVVTSTWQLGITGTFLGDYFGILMDHRVEGFPFNVLTDPMYVGSVMSFVGTSLWYESPVGLLISLYVYIGYVIALQFEGCVCLSFSSVVILIETPPIGHSLT